MEEIATPSVPDDILQNTFMLSLSKGNIDLSEKKSSLLFIPDISGFTNFVRETEIQHSRHIIAELLELIIDNDELGLTVAEIEGDAILFYKHQELPTLKQIIKQVEKTFIAFHEHLVQYEQNRICPCGACKTANKLTVKFIAHAANFDFIRVKNFEKPYGKDVILAHRLLKNNTSTDEYLLLTDAMVANNEDYSILNGEQIEHGNREYQGIGNINYQVIPLAKLHAKVSLKENPVILPKSENPKRHILEVNCSMDRAFEILTNFEFRLKWNTALKKIKFEKDRVNRIGAIHQCVVNGKDVNFETIVNNFGENKVVYGERILNFPFAKDVSNYFILEQKEKSVQVTAELHMMKLNSPFTFISNFFEAKAANGLKKGLESFKAVCEGDEI